MAHHILGQSRTQTTLLPEVLDDFVTEDNPVRVVDVFVDGLDLQTLGFERVIATGKGRPGYHPAVMLKLYIYGYLNRIQSSRRLEKESHRNVELMWLLTRLMPDFKTIADFRKDNGKGIKAVCRQFVQMCRQMNMFADSLFAIDGSKFKAVNSKDNNYLPSNVKYRINKIEKSIEEYLSKMDTQDKTEKSDDKATPSKLEWLQKRLAELRVIEEEVNAHPDKQVSKNDPDARLLLTRHLNRQVCYNVQTAVDTKHHLIISHDIDKAADRGQLTSVAKQVQEVMKKKDITVLADKGYFSRLDIKASHDLGITVNVPQTDTSGSAKKGIFNKSLFIYDKDKDIYICPAGEELPHKRNVTEKDVEQKVLSKRY